MAYTKYGFFLRWITMLVSRRKGGPTDMTRDHETTDWDAVDHFASDLARIFQPRPERPRDGEPLRIG
jgi:menaquinone-dependent protoporphyrinogen IX oxidase